MRKKKTSGTLRRSLKKRTKPSENELELLKLERILDLGSKLNVSVLKFQGIYVSFHEPVKVLFTDPAYGPQDLDSPPAPVPVAMTDKQHKAQNDRSIEQDELRLKEERLAQILIEDPELYERLLRDGELTDSGSSDGDESDE